MNNHPRKFTQVLNDTIDYFLLGDIKLLRDYKNKKGLSNDLATEYTTNESGDEIVSEGVLIPMSKITNQPYTVIFNVLEGVSEFENVENNLIYKKEGYILKVENNKVILFTWWILNDFNDEKVEELFENPEKWNKPFVEVENGWYDVEVLGGFTKQKSGEDYDFEPTLEFKLTLKEKKGDFRGAVNESFELADNK
ncbi:hypothetical protein [Maribacter sp. Asnod2-G09]|uniref:hypothetical protein n=1 Tax=Maribacter sp. Asnod2-G09 TaxID=3160577 RepID=UPI003867813E